jgi:hypothetical protein
MSASDHEHCSFCFVPSACSQRLPCPLVACPNLCAATFHACKTHDHVHLICPNQPVPCINATNGCRLRLRRALLGAHLAHCPASVLECTSFKVRRLLNRHDKHHKLKHPCPVELERQQLASRSAPPAACEDINKVLLDQDYTSLAEFARDKPLRFSRLYGYLVGLDVGKDFSLQTNFAFLSRLLRPVKSQVFKGNPLD